LSGTGDKINFLIPKVREEFMRRFCEQLRRAGVDAAPLNPKSPDVWGGGSLWLDAYHPQESLQILGAMSVKGRSYQQLQLWERRRPADPFGERWRDAHFLVRGERVERGPRLRAELREIKKGLFGKGLAGLRWEGGRLAEVLNGDAELHGWLLRGVRARVSPDQDNRCVRLIVALTLEESRDPDLIISRTVDHLQTCERIAQHVRRLMEAPVEAKKEPAVKAELSELEREAQRVVPLRKYRGFFSVQDLHKDLPEEQRKELQELEKRHPQVARLLPIHALHYADGKRSLLEISRLAEYETGKRDLEFLVRYFGLLRKADLVELKTAG